jgi:hypothetical protein
MPEELVDWAATLPGPPRNMANINTGANRVHRMIGFPVRRRLPVATPQAAFLSGFQISNFKSQISNFKSLISTPIIVPEAGVSCLDRK